MENFKLLKKETKKKFDFALKNRLRCKIFVQKFKKLPSGWYQVRKTDTYTGTIIDYSKHYITVYLSDGSIKKARKFIVYDKSGNKFLSYIDLYFLQ